MSSLTNHDPGLNPAVGLAFGMGIASYRARLSSNSSLHIRRSISGSSLWADRESVCPFCYSNGVAIKVKKYTDGFKLLFLAARRLVKSHALMNLSWKIEVPERRTVAKANKSFMVAVMQPVIGWLDFADLER